LRVWRDADVDTAACRNVRYTAAEKEQLLTACRSFLSEQGITEEAFWEQLEEKRVKRQTWNGIASMANLPHRSVHSIHLRLRRHYGGLFGKWSQEKTDRLTELVLMSTQVGERPSWKAISKELGGTPEHCRDKWRNVCGGGKKGIWNSVEVFALRQGICELTNDLAPVKDIPWNRVVDFVPHRSKKQCMDYWYRALLPKLLSFQDRNGVAVDTAVFERHLLRKLKKQTHQPLGLIDWRLINTWWSSAMNRNKWRELVRRVPRTVSRKDEIWGDEDDIDFEASVQWLFEVNECKRYRKWDKRVLKHALLVLDAEALRLEEAEGA